MAGAPPSGAPEIRLSCGRCISRTETARLRDQPQPTIGLSRWCTWAGAWRSHLLLAIHCRSVFLPGERASASHGGIQTPCGETFQASRAPDARIRLAEGRVTPVRHRDQATRTDQTAHPQLHPGTIARHPADLCMPATSARLRNPEGSIPEAGNADRESIHAFSSSFSRYTFG
jgi:hypothetical protein